MSVMACNRKDCDSIMCDKLILNCTRYICYKCYYELLTYKANYMVIGDKTKTGVKNAIIAFMDTPPGTYLELSNDELEEEFNQLIGNKNEEY